MRGQIGDSVTLFDGSGLSWTGIVENIAKNAVMVRILRCVPDSIESPLRLTMATALPKGERQRFLVEKLAELGVVKFMPLRLERSVARADKKTTAKFRRYVIEAAKQCGRNVCMEITEEMPLADLLTPHNGHCPSDDDLKLILHPTSLGAEKPARPRNILAEIENRTQMICVVGPEGSFTDAEIQAALAAGFQTLDLGARILRTETACVAAAAAFLTF